MGADLLDFDGTFFRGQKSDTDPGQIPLGYYFSGVNVVNQGGVISCRPGYRCIITLPEGNLQGGAFFRPKQGLEELVVAIDGRVFTAPFPFVDFRQLVNIQFLPSAKQVFFEMTEQSARRLDDTLGSAIELIAPRAVLILQDGGDTAPAYYDGTTADHIRNRPFETIVGGAMKWIGDRLWIANGTGVRASDIANPFSFREDIYLGGKGEFSFTGEVTALAVTPSLEFPQLLVFTAETCSILQANIRVRSEWLITPDFQRQIFDVGCTSQRSVVSHFGQLSWFSQHGFTQFDAAALSKKDSRLPLRDSEMATSKTLLFDDLSQVAGGSFGNYLLMSVPAADQFNLHTWVLNNASIETLQDTTGPSWASVWTGTRPVQWLCGDVAGTARAFYLSKDLDGSNRLWEAFTPDRLDSGCPIMWAAELRGYFGQTSQSKKLVGSDCKFRYVQIALTAIEEGLDIGVFYAGSLRGAYKQVVDSYVVAAKGSLDNTVEIGMEDYLVGFKAQSRTIRSQDVNDAVINETGSCPVEAKTDEAIDESFQIMVVGHGPATIRWVRVFADARPEFETGDPETACSRETEVNAVRFDGYGIKEADIPTATAALEKNLTRFTAQRTQSLTYAGITAVGSGSAESYVSQEAADRVADIIAIKTAENEIMAQLPKILSAGESIE